MKDDPEKEYTIQHARFYHEEDSIEPPPPGFVSKFNSIHDWLKDICEKEKPETEIATYNFGLFESTDEYVLFLVGLNTTKKEKNHSLTRIEFEPVNTYFPLPATEFKNLTRDEVIEKISAQLK